MIYFKQSTLANVDEGVVCSQRHR